MNLHYIASSDQIQYAFFEQNAYKVTRYLNALASWRVGFGAAPTADVKYKRLRNWNENMIEIFITDPERRKILART
jgi:hypothetical protein